MNGQNFRIHWNGLAAWLVLAIGCILSIVPLISPAPPDNPAADAFSATRAFEHIEQIAQEARPIGSPADQKARNAIVAKLEGMGLEADIQLFTAPDYYRGTGQLVELGNVIARIPGTAPTFAVALVGHFDTLPDTPGANDDASAVAILLESARAILAGPRPKQDVILVFIDGEEPAPRFGSTAFITGHPWAREVQFVINLEAIGFSGPSLLTEISGPNSWMVDQYVKAAPYPAAYSFLTSVTKMIGGSNTDFATFREEGIAGVEFVYMRGSSIYHTPADNPSRLSLSSLNQHGTNTLALARQVSNLDAIPPADYSEDIFFTTAFSKVIRPPPEWALPISILTFLCLLACLWRTGGWLRALWGAGWLLLFLIFSAILAIGIWLLLVAWRGTLGVAESYLYLAGISGLAASIGIGLANKIGKCPADLAWGSGVIFIWWLFGLLTFISAPGISYLFAWPAFIGALVQLWKITGAGRIYQPIVSALAISVVLVVMAPPVDVFLQFAQPRPGNPDSEILFTIALPAILIALVVGWVWVFWMRTIKIPSLKSQ